MYIKRYVSSSDLSCAEGYFRSAACLYPHGTSSKSCSRLEGCMSEALGRLAVSDITICIDLLLLLLSSLQGMWQNINANSARHIKSETSFSYFCFEMSKMCYDMQL